VPHLQTAFLDGAHQAAERIGHCVEVQIQFGDLIPGVHSESSAQITVLHSLHRLIDRSYRGGDFLAKEQHNRDRQDEDHKQEDGNIGDQQVAHSRRKLGRVQSYLNATQIPAWRGNRFLIDPDILLFDDLTVLDLPFAVSHCYERDLLLSLNICHHLVHQIGLKILQVVRGDGHKTGQFGFGLGAHGPFQSLLGGLKIVITAGPEYEHHNRDQEGNEFGGEAVQIDLHGITRCILLKAGLSPRLR